MLAVCFGPRAQKKDCTTMQNLIATTNMTTTTTIRRLAEEILVEEVETGMVHPSHLPLKSWGVRGWDIGEGVVIALFEGKGGLFGIDVPL
jgi:hypothetical protein